MKRLIGRKLALVLLMAAGCSDGGPQAGGGQGGAAAGHTGTTDGATDAGTGTDTGATGGRGAGGTDASATDSGGAIDGGADGGVGWLTPPAMPPVLVAPARATVKIHVHAEGAQIYTCTSTGSDAGADASSDGGVAGAAWVLKAPDAKLYDAGGVQVGTHGAGPSWTYGDGSVVNGVKVAELPSPLSDAISWLLLRASSTSGTGVFSDISYVQRLSTSGGKAPATGCDPTTVGTEIRVAYTAEYYFYSGGAGADWLPPPANLPAAIAVPATAHVKLHYRGVGMQIYGCLANGGVDAGTADAGADAGPPVYAWVFKAPEATLFDMNFVPAGLHGMGPSWTSGDGSMVTARALAQVNSPLADAIPWLLLMQTSTSGVGEFSDVAIIQRLNTAGGKAPTTPCDASNVNTLSRIPYSADYYFFTDSGNDAGAGD
jgi:hypothetical protein